MAAFLATATSLEFRGREIMDTKVTITASVAISGGCARNVLMEAPRWFGARQEEDDDDDQ